jgi:hypothetical protein
MRIKIMVKNYFYRGVAQPGSAPALGAGSRRFKSSRPDQPSFQFNDIGEFFSYLCNELKLRLGTPSSS